MPAAGHFMDPLLESLRRQFEIAVDELYRLVYDAAPGSLFRRPAEQSVSPGFCLIRSAAAIERACGGLSTRLWDDPFEWTLPEQFLREGALEIYLSDVRRAVETTFAMMPTDNALARVLPAPRELRTVFDVLLDALIESAQWRGRAALILPGPGPAAT
jgi:hypothetical protein